MWVYIANATKQNLQFAYRLPERKAPIMQHVPWGQQKRLTEDMSQLDIDAIMEQWGKYGLIPVGELESNRHKFQGYLISVGKQISYDTMVKAFKVRAAVLKAKGRDQRELAAIEMVNTIERHTQTPANQYEVSVAEIEPDRGFSAPDLEHIAEGFRITRDRPDMPEAPTPARGRRRAA